MNRTELACWAMIASAVVLAGLLIDRLNTPLIQPAHADLLIAENGYSLMTTRTRDDEQALFVLDNFNEKLTIYTLDITGKQIEQVASEEVSRLFGTSTGDRRGGRVPR